MTHQVKNISKWERMQKGVFQESHQQFRQAIKRGAEKGYPFNDFSQDLFSALYQPSPEYRETATPGSEWQQKALETMEGLREWKELRQSGTVSDSFQSGLGATVLSRHFAEELPKQEQENPDDIQEKIDTCQDFLESNPDHVRADEIQKRVEALQESHGLAISSWQDTQIEEQELRIALRKALHEARQEIREADETAGAFGFGSEPGQDGYTNNPKIKLQIAEQIKNNPKLKQIAELAGRFRREARKVQSNKKLPGPDEITDIEIGNDLGRVLPTELMKLCDEETEIEFFKKFLEGNLMQYKLETQEKETRGPIVFCLDNSSSMKGINEIVSKSLFLGIAQIAIDQRRNIMILHFNTGVPRIDRFSVDNIDPEKLIETCAYFAGGGTSFEPAFNRAFSIITCASANGFKKADLIFITDGLCSFDSRILEQLKKAKITSSAHVYSIIIGAKREKTVLHEISDSVQFVQDFLENADDVTETIFSI